MTEDQSFKAWLSGFIDGEGSFCIVKESKGSGYRVGMSIQLREDDGYILEECRNRLGIGSLCRCAPAGNNPSHTYKWDIRSHDDCLKLIEVLDVHPLRAKKRRDYALWREAAALRRSVLPASGSGDYKHQRMLSNTKVYAKIEALRQEMNAGRVLA